jgi:ubiquinone/menaquinone biosynthesis C-methylase UbiE
MARSDIQAGMRVLEIGCGSGGYTTYLARAAGPTGKVCALDIQPAMLELLAAKLARPENQDIHNVKCFAESAYALPFEDDTFDRVVLITVLQEIPDRERALVEARRVLKPGGKLAITEFLPDPDYALARTTVKLGTAVGLHLDALLGNLWTYTARFVK